MDADRLAKLVTQVLEETRDLRQEMKARLDSVDTKIDGLGRELRLVERAVVETADSMKRVEEKVDVLARQVAQARDTTPGARAGGGVGAGRLIRQARRVAAETKSRAIPTRAHLAPCSA